MQLAPSNKDIRGAREQSPLATRWALAAQVARERIMQLQRIPSGKKRAGYTTNKRQGASKARRKMAKASRKQNRKK